MTPTVVKKYANRRLYDTGESRYVTMDELADKIRRGIDVRIVDAASGDDLTQVTLTQIILESRGAARMLPVPLLMQLIRLGDDALAEFLGRYVSAAMDLYLQAKQGAQQVAAWNPLATMPFSATSALARLLGGVFWPGEPAAPPPPPAGAQGGQPAASEVADLRRELDELKAALRKKRR
jgi:polyhydroxyalkanoate synthesis repressor PhaR